MRESDSKGGAGLTMALIGAFVLLAAGTAMILYFRWQAARRDYATRRARTVAEQLEAKAVREAGADVGFSAAGVGDALGSIETQIRRVLALQLEAWNAGDIDAFMEHYWKSDELTFSSGGQTTRSWRKTLERYKERYPTRAAMGETSFTNLEVTPLGAGAALVLGQWQLRREGETIGGNFTLVFRRIDGKWVIIHDHTSLASGAGG